MLHKQQTITVLTAAALIAASAGPAALAAQVSGSMTLTVGSPYLTNNGTSAAIDAQGTTPVVESPGYTLLPLRGVVEAMGGTPLPTGDVGYQVEAFACIPVRYLFWEGDDEFPAQANMLFDASATDYIHGESIVTIGSYGLFRLAELAGLPLARGTFSTP